MLFGIKCLIKKNYVQFKIKMPLKSNFANNNNVVNEQIQLMKFFFIRTIKMS